MESLLVGEINRARVLSQTGAREHALKNAGGLLAEMIFLKSAGEDGVEAVNQRPVETSCGRAHQTTCACALHNAEWHAEDLSARPGTQHVGVSNVEVVARDCDIQVIFECQSDRVIERQIELAIVHELVDAGRVREIGLSHVSGEIGANGIGKMRHGFGIIHHRHGPRFRRILRGGSGGSCGRLLAPARQGQHRE